ncbi:MAG: hypothetical protein GF329_15135 [Candidatus Lokiarchaeota archaeon]|nr:hypothetical protein [Candidatus Lokiarchaeota archaeon]
MPEILPLPPHLEQSLIEATPQIQQNILQTLSSGGTTQEAQQSALQTWIGEMDSDGFFKNIKEKLFGDKKIFGDLREKWKERRPKRIIMSIVAIIIVILVIYVIAKISFSGLKAYKKSKR